MKDKRRTKQALFRIYSEEAVNAASNEMRQYRFGLMNIRMEQRYRCGGRKEAVEQLVRIDKRELILRWSGRKADPWMSPCPGRFESIRRGESWAQG